MSDKTRRGRKWTHYLDVVGLAFRLKRDARRALADTIAKSGPIDGMQLRREPGNPKDPNAIAVYLPDRLLSGRHIGYVRATVAELLAERIDAGRLDVVSAKLQLLRAEDDYNEGELHIVFQDIERVSEPAKRKQSAKT